MADPRGHRPEDDLPITAYLAPRFWPEDEVLTGLVDDLRQTGPQIHVGADSGRVLQVLAATLGARRVLEVGTLYGYSAIWMGRGMAADGHLDTIEFAEKRADRAEHWLRRAGLGDRVTVHRGAALGVLPRLEGPYDLAFLDAVKAEYTAYLDHCLRLVRPGGLICADNVRWGGQVADPAVDDPDTNGLRAYLDRIATDPRLLSTVLVAGDGLAVSLVR